MSKVETATNDAKALALRCKALEMQLRQSVPRKDHLETTSKLERQIASLEKDLDRARTETQKTIAINKQIVGVESQIAAVIKATNGLGKTLDSLDSTTSTTRKALAEQARTIDSIGAKIVQGTVPSGIHLESLSKIRNLESNCAELSRQIGNMVPTREYVSMRDRFEEASRKISTMVAASDLEEANRKIGTMVPASELEEANSKISTMVPASDFADQKRRADDLEATISTMVPREQFAASEARVGELEGMLAYRVPQTVYDDLVSRVVSLAEAVTGGEVPPEPSEAFEAEPVAERIFEAPAAEAVPEVTIQPPQADVPVPADAPVEPSPQQIIPVSPVVAEAPEIREVQSQLAELNSKAQEGQPIEVPAAATTIEAAPETPVASGNSAPQVVSVTTNGLSEQAAAVAESSDHSDSAV